MQGRDVGHHVLSFLDILGPQKSPTSFFSFLVGDSHIQYGPGLKAVYYAFWKPLGTYPSTFVGVNLVALFCSFVLMAYILRRTKTNPAWVLVASIVLTGSWLGTRIYYSVGIDAVYTLGALAAFAVIVLPEPSKLPWPVIGTVIFASLFLRLNALFYLVAPLGYLIVTERLWRPSSQPIVQIVNACKKRWFWSALAIVFGAGVVLFYGTKVDDYVTTFLPASVNFGHVDDLNITLWSWSNWSWFVRYLPEFLAPGVLVVLVPAAVAGWWWGFKTKRLAVALFALVPVFLYTLVIGTRYVEYITPSLILLMVCAVMGIGRIKSFSLRAILAGYLILVSLLQLFLTLGANWPLVTVGTWSPPDSVIRRMLTPTDNLGFKLYGRGRFATAHRLLDTALPKDRESLLGLMGFEKDCLMPTCMPATLAPFLESTHVPLRYQAFDSAQAVQAARPDLLLVLELAAPSQPAFPAVPRSYREVFALIVIEELVVHAYLPDPMRPAGTAPAVPAP